MGLERRETSPCPLTLGGRGGARGGRTGVVKMETRRRRGILSALAVPSAPPLSELALLFLSSLSFQLTLKPRSG